jgi:hypothetical protein
VEGEDVYIDHIIKLELFGEEISRIERQYGLVRSPRELTSHPHNKRFRLPNGPRAFVNAPDLEITSTDARQGRFPAYEELYDCEMRRLVRDCFAADFEAYGYDG